MYEAVQKVKKMADAVRGKAKDIQNWMLSFDYLDSSKVTPEHKETWKVILKDW